MLGLANRQLTAAGRLQDWANSTSTSTPRGANDCAAMHLLMGLLQILPAIALVPQNGSMILYNRKKVKYRKDGYCWKKRKDGKTTREDHMKLKVQGVESQHISSRWIRLMRHINRTTARPLELMEQTCGSVAPPY
ncbi:calmodulin-binding transcription activator 1-like isoform X3 [Tachysurus ichikawai]